MTATAHTTPYFCEVYLILKFGHFHNENRLVRRAVFRVDTDVKISIHSSFFSYDTDFKYWLIAHQAVLILLF